MDYNDIDKVMSLKCDYDKLEYINNKMTAEDRPPLYVSIWNNSERMELPKSVSEKLGVLIKQEMMNIMEKIKEL